MKTATVGLGITILALPLFLAGCSAKGRHASGGLPTPVFDNQDSPPADQPSGPWALGNDFTVNAGQTVLITSMGTFDDGGNGLKGNVLVGIYNSSTRQKVEGTFVVFKPGDTSYPLANQTRWQKITPVLLRPGKYTVVAANYGQTTDQLHASAHSPLWNNRESRLRFNNLGGAVFLEGGRWLSQDQDWSSLPDLLPAFTVVSQEKSSAKPLFAAGTFTVHPPEPGLEGFVPAALPQPPHSVPDAPTRWIALTLLLLLTLELFLKLRTHKTQ